jgi:hypothetical protein
MTSLVGIIVDGEGDYASMRRRFTEGFRVLKTDGPRGHSAMASDIAIKSRKQVLMLAAFRCRRVVVVLDFESRSVRYSEFCADLVRHFQSTGFPVPVTIAVPNRMIENWYLADIEFLATRKTFLREGIQQKAFEGKDGKAMLKRFMRKGTPYSETKHGPELFEIVRFDVARQNSASFDAFLSQVSAAH